MSPRPVANTLAERYDLGLRRLRNRSLCVVTPRPLPTKFWPKENIEFLRSYHEWLLGGGVSEMVVNAYHVMMAGHVLGLHLKPYFEIDPDNDLVCALEFVMAHQPGASWAKNCERSLLQFRRYLRLERGLGEESKATPFNSARVTAGLPLWLVSELERFQHIHQRNWRDARVQENIRRFWSSYLRMWRFFVEERNVLELKDLRRQHVLDYLDKRLGEGHSVTGVNNNLRELHVFLTFLQEEGYAVSNSLLRIPGLKQPDPLPRYLTDEQVRKLCEEVERTLAETRLASRRRLAILVRAIFYLLWQGGLRISEAEELRLEDLDLEQKRLSVRDGKGRKDRTVYLAPTAVRALQAYLRVRGEGSGDHVFLFRNAPLRKDFIRGRLSSIGEKVGVKVYPHRLRHTCATQLLNAGCPVTSIQRFLGHKELSSTMIYARAHDQTVANDYFAAMQRVEQRLEILPVEQSRREAEQEKKEADVKVLPVLPETLAQPHVCSSEQRIKLLEFADQLARPDLGWGERLSIAAQLLMLFGVIPDHPPPAPCDEDGTILHGLHSGLMAIQ